MIRPSVHPRRSGSVLITVLLLSGALALLSASFLGSVRSSLATASLDHHALRAGFAAESGASFLHKRVLANPGYTGTAGTWIGLGDGSEFRLTHQDTATTVDGWELQFLVEGRHADGLQQLETRFRLFARNPLMDMALVLLGGTHKLRNFEVDGDMLLADEVGAVLDYLPAEEDPDQGEWGPGGASAIGEITLERVDLDGTLHKFSENEWLGGGVPETVRDEPVTTPAINLAMYLEPGPDRVILDHSGRGNLRLNGRSYQETLVVIVDRDARIDIDHCDLDGGMVVYSDPYDDLRQGPQNEIVIGPYGNTFGMGDEGVHPNIGLIAPASGLCISACPGYEQELRGFNVWNRVGNSTHFNVEGQLVVINEVDAMKTGSVVYDPEVAANPPVGIRFGNVGRTLSLEWVRETYQAIP